MKNYSKLLEAMLSGEYVTVKEKGLFEDNEVKVLNIDHTEEVEVEDWTGGTTILHIDDFDFKPKKLEEDGEYYLFGEQVCNIYDDGDFTKVEDFAKEEGGASVGYHKFIDAITLLDEYDGFAGFRKITKEEYIRVFNALEK